MPNRDGTGPNGAGPKTGGQRGNCPGTKPGTFGPRRDGTGRGNRPKRGRR